MAYEFKKLSDVNVIESTKDGLNVLVEDGGEIVKIAVDDMIPAPIDEIALIAGSETLEEVHDDMTVLVEVNGEIKRVPSNGFGGGNIVITYDGTNYTCNVPYEEFESAVLAGYPLVYVDTNDKWSSSNVSVSYNHNGEYWAVRAVDTYGEVTVTLQVTESGVEKEGVA